MLVLAAAGGCSESTEPLPPDPGQSAPAAPVPAVRPGKTFVYTCDDSLRFTARVEGETTWLFLPSGTLKLQQTAAASGARYEDGSVMFWTKADEAMLDRGDQQRLQCVNDRAAAIWEDAKLRGVDFRGRGNEPGWHIEISGQYGIVFVTNYGSGRYRFRTYQSAFDEETRKTTFAARDGESEIRVTLEGKRCIDSMSDEQFETTVIVVIDGNRLNGCGKPLH
jgi:membrane-bound inhibitor of C-type lysozyme